MKNAAALLLVGALMAACGDDAPKHYYVLCEDVDGAGWKLVDYRKDSKGYLVSCTYQSPDQSQVRTRSCGAEGCN